MEIKTIVVTGGPCAGKTTAMDWIRKDIAKLGYRVLVVPETATELITGGVCPWTCGTNYAYQTIQMHMQEEKEKAYRQAAETMESQVDKILIVCDRGIYDNMVYMTKKEFYSILEDVMGRTEEEVLGHYDRVFHLTTSAIGTDAFGTTNNEIRYEDAEVSRWMDEKFIMSWSVHPSHYKINSNQDFDLKMETLINGIADFLGCDKIYPEAPLPEALPQLPRNEEDWAQEAVFPE